IFLKLLVHIICKVLVQYRVCYQYCLLLAVHLLISILFFFNDTATTEIYTLSLHDALPILLIKHKDEYASKKDITKEEKSVQSGKDRKSTRLNSSHVKISYAVFCLKKKKNNGIVTNRPNMKSLTWSVVIVSRRSELSSRYIW